MSKKAVKEIVMEDPNQYDLSAEELTSFNPPVLLEIPERMKNGRPGIVFIRELPTPDVLAIMNTKGEGQEWLFDLMGLAIVKRDGSLMFTPGSLRTLKDTSFSIFGKLQAKVLEINPIHNPGGVNPLETTISSESPTN